MTAVFWAVMSKHLCCSTFSSSQTKSLDNFLTCHSTRVTFLRFTAASSSIEFIQKIYKNSKSQNSMETSLRFDSEQKGLFIQAKENFVQGNSLLFQVRGLINTASGKVGGFLHLRKKFVPKNLTSVDLGAKVDFESLEVTYSVRGKKTFELADSGLLSLDLKGGYFVNASSKEGSTKASVELSQKIFNFTDDQDLKIKAGWDIVGKKPFLQLRENNWTFNADLNNGFKDISWNVSYDL